MTVSFSIIVPAHNEASVIGRCLASLTTEASGKLRYEVIVVCNGCSDATAVRARAFENVVVLETEVASKTHALNLGDAVASFPSRVYLDADVEIRVEDLHWLVSALAAPVQAASPRVEFSSRGSSALVKRYYSARSRLKFEDPVLWGSGCYALSAEGRARFGCFPDVLGDDLWIDLLFSTDEKVVVSSAVSVVHVPRRLRDVIRITGRNYRGADALQSRTSSLNAVLRLGRTVHGFSSFLDAIVYLAVASLAQSRAHRFEGRWEKDLSSREA